MIPRFKKSRFEPKPIETDYWIDLNENEYGGVFKYYDNNAMVWKQTESITKEREPQFVNSAAYNITTTDISNWNAKVGIEDFDALKEEVLNLGSEGEYVTMETLKYYLDIFAEDNGLSDETLITLNNKADKATTLSGYGIQDAYTKDEINKRFADWKVDLPENVSAFKNDVGYVTEETLSEKLPEDIVSDANYVHTDNNFTSSHKQSIEDMPYKFNELKQADEKITKTVETYNSANQGSIQSLKNDIVTITNNLTTKANADDVYTKTYLDELHSQFVTKKHAVYGFINERPTLEVGDTGHIFYDYTVNEALIWIADEWRILRTNEALENFILDEDIDETGIGMWEIEASNDSQFGRLTKYIGDYETTIDLVVPNVYIKWFTLALNKDTTTPLVSIQRDSNSVGIVFSNTNVLGELMEKEQYVKADRTETYVAYPVEENEEWYNNNEPTDIFGNTVLSKPLKSIAASGVTYSAPYNQVDTDNVLVNSYKLSQGIRRIENGSFQNVKAATNNDLAVPSGVEYIGHFAFFNSSVKTLTFPRNPVKFGYATFARNPLTKVTLPKTLDFEDIKLGGGSYLFSEGTADLTVELKEGVRAIPRYCFRTTKVKSINFPSSLEHVGKCAFYDSYVPGELNTTNIDTIESWAFRNNNFTKITFGEKLKYIAPMVFARGNQSPCTSVNMPLNVEKLYYGSFPTNLYNCGTPLVTPPGLKNLPYNFAGYYGYNINASAQKLEIPLVLSEGLESIGTYSFNNSMFTGELIFPDSLKYLQGGAFARNLRFTNTTLRIGKNLKVIAGVSPYGAHVRAVMEDFYPMYQDRLHPVSKNNYPFFQFYDYLEDGGEVASYAWETFYLFGLQTMTAFEVDPENKWFKAIDGVLYTKDGKRLVGYPCARNTTRLEIPEGCEYLDANVFAGSGYKYKVTMTNSAGTEVTFYPGNRQSAYPTDTFYGENPLREVVLPNTIINYTPMEMLEKFPSCWLGDTENMLCAASNYFTGIERFIVKDDNPRYKNDGDFLLSKDGKTLEVLTNGMKGYYTIPSSVTTIKPGAICLNLGASGASSNREAAQHRPTSAQCVYPATMWMGLNLTIPKSVVNMDDYTLYAFNVLNKMSNSSVTFEDDNPAFTYNSSTGNYERV